MHIGFTGTRYGMTDPQRATVAAILRELGDDVTFHHGDCIGADDQADAIAANDLRLWRVIHPPTISRHRAFCDRKRKGVGLQVLAMKPYIPRNHDIVEACALVIGAPQQSTEQSFGGTWATIRYARAYGTALRIVGPDGVER